MEFSPLSDMPSPNPAPTPGADALPEERPGLRRTAWILVITMSVLMALAFLGVVWGFMRQGRVMMEGRQEAAATLPAARTGDALATLTLAPGVRIVSAQTGNGRLVLHLTGPTGDEVQVIDLSSGQLSQQIKTAPAP